MALCKTIRSINEGPFKSDSKGPGCLSGGGGFAATAIRLCVRYPQSITNMTQVKCLKDTTKFASFAFCRCFLITRIKEAISFLMMIGWIHYNSCWKYIDKASSDSIYIWKVIQLTVLTTFLWLMMAQSIVLVDSRSSDRTHIVVVLPFVGCALLAIALVLCWLHH